MENLRGLFMRNVIKYKNRYRDDLIKLYIRNIMEYDLEVRNINKEYMDDILINKSDDYEYIKAFNLVFTKLLHNYFSHKIHESVPVYGIEINNLLNRIKMISTSANVQGDVYLNSFMYLENNAIIKRARDIRNIENKHEFFVGMYLNKLRKRIPNFMYVYNLIGCNGPNMIKDVCRKDDVLLIAERIYGDTFLNYLEKGKMTEEIFYNSIIQICLAMQMAYENFKYVHRDLHFGNVMLTDKMKDKVYIRYDSQISNDDLYVKTDFYVKIIDYGYSYININDEHYIEGDDIENRTFTREQLNIINNKPSYPGLDLYKFFGFVSGSINNKNYDLDTINKFRRVIDNIKNAYINLGIKRQVVYDEFGNRRKYCLPSTRDDKLLNLQPIQFLHSFMNYVPDKFKGILSTKPDKGIRVIGENFEKERFEEIVNKLITIETEDINKECIGESWKKLKRTWINKEGKVMNDYMCGVKKEDKEFNTIKFSKDVSVYHSSTVIANKFLYYPNKRENVYKNIIINKNDEENIERFYEKMPSGDPLYFTDEKSVIKSCNKEDKCILAYKFIRSVELLDMNNTRNIIELYISIKNNPDLYRYIPMDVDRVLNNASPYMENENVNTVFNNFMLDLIKNNSMTLIRSILSYCNKINIHGICLYTREEGLSFIFGKKYMKYVARDFSNKLDYQYFDNNRLFGEIGKLIVDMKKYKIIDINNNDGDPYEKSVWTTLYVQDFVSNRYGISKLLSMEDYNLCIVTGFLNNIGMFGDHKYIFYDKPNKSKVGYEYMTEMKEYNIGNSVLDIPKLLQNMNIPLNVQKYISMTILLSDVLEKYYNKIEENSEDMLIENLVHRYLNEILSKKEVRENFIEGELQRFMIILMIVSICNITSKNFYSQNSSTKIFNYPYIINQPRKYLARISDTTHGRELGKLKKIVYFSELVGKFINDRYYINRINFKENVLKDIKNTEEDDYWYRSKNILIKKNSPEKMSINSIEDIEESQESRVIEPNINDYIRSGSETYDSSESENESEKGSEYRESEKESEKEEEDEEIEKLVMDLRTMKINDKIDTDKILKLQEKIRRDEEYINREKERMEREQEIETERRNREIDRIMRIREKRMRDKFDIKRKFKIDKKSKSTERKRRNDKKIREMGREMGRNTDREEKIREKYEDLEKNRMLLNEYYKRNEGMFGYDEKEIKEQQKRDKEESTETDETDEESKEVSRGEFRQIKRRKM